MSDSLKLQAEDEEDITIMSAYLQDAVTVASDMVYQPKSYRFVIMLNRYTWEKQCAEMGYAACQRIRCGLHFNSVLKVTSQNIPLDSKTHPLELLAIETNGQEKGLHVIDFIFSGDGIIRLETEVIDAQMEDIGDPWPAKCHPKHEILDNLKA